VIHAINQETQLPKHEDYILRIDQSFYMAEYPSNYVLLN
jgi:hypothetical protein